MFYLSPSSLQYIPRLTYSANRCNRSNLIYLAYFASSEVGTENYKRKSHVCKDSKDIYYYCFHGTMFTAFIYNRWSGLLEEDLFRGKKKLCFKGVGYLAETKWI
jgi:hypothetical protein